jgi:hypothetical protein
MVLTPRLSCPPDDSFRLANITTYFIVFSNDVLCALRLPFGKRVRVPAQTRKSLPVRSRPDLMRAESLAKGVDAPMTVE